MIQIISTNKAQRSRLKINNPLRRIFIILLMLVLLPGLFYLSIELFTLDEDERLIFQMYEQQLDVILFSINQYTWDYINNWKSEIDADFTGKDSRNGIIEKPQALLNDTALRAIFIEDTLQGGLNVKRLIQSGQIEIDQANAEFLASEKLARRLTRYQKAGYQKIESVLLRGAEASGDERMLLISLTNSGKILYMMVDFRPFIEQVIVPKLESIAADNFALGVFTGDNYQVIYQNENFDFEKAQVTKKLWLFPDYLIGIRTKGKSIEELARSRFYDALIYNSILIITLLIGALLIFRNIRREVQLAQMKSDFVSNVSHELRTPLALIRMYAETLEMGRVKNDAKRMEYYRTIFKESERLTRLINNILNFSRIESGRKEYHFQSVDLNAIVVETIDTYSWHFKNKGFELHLNLIENLPEIHADTEAITESIINLMDNSVKYSDKEKYIEISTDFDQTNVYLNIKDKGIGISPKDLPHIFDKFYRVSSGPVHNTKGSGLGLTLVQHIIQVHGGTIDVQSTPDKGTTFRLIFPLPDESRSDFN